MARRLTFLNHIEERGTSRVIVLTWVVAWIVFWFAIGYLLAGAAGFGT